MIGLGLSLSIGSQVGAESDEAKALFARMSTPPSGVARSATNAFINGLKSDGVWDRLDCLQVYSTAISGTQADLLLNWKSNSANGTAVNSPTFSVGGVTGDGATSYVNTGYNTQNFGGLLGRDDNHISCFVSNTTALTTIPFGNSQFLIIPLSGTSTILSRDSTNGTLGTAATFATANGLTLCNRTGSGGYDVYRDSAFVQTISSASAALTSFNMFVGARNNAGTTDGHATHTVFGVTMGGSLTAGQVSALNSRMTTFKAALGA